MKTALCVMFAGVALPAVDSCVPTSSVETRLMFLNFSTSRYAALGVREHVDAGVPREFVRTPLLPPGAIFRMGFLDLIDCGCPESLDLQVLIFRRVNDDVPIGLDEGEEVESVPVVAGQITGLPGPCAVASPLGVYTVVNWEAPEGSARVKLAQDSEIEDLIEASGRFEPPDLTWEISGVAPALASVPPPPAIEMDTVSGLVTLPDGTGVVGVGVLLRTKYRVHLDEADWSDPITYTITDESGEFAFERPPGVYRVEFFSDDYVFGPQAAELESPLNMVWVLAEPL